MTTLSDWLNDPTAERVVLVEVQAGTGTALYIGSDAYTVDGADPDLPNVFFRPRLLGDPEVFLQVGGVFFEDRQTRATVGTFEITNIDGALNSYLAEDFDNRVVNVYIGDPSWTFANFEQVLSARSEGLENRDGLNLTLTVRDKSLELDISVPVDRFADSTDAPGAPIPVCLGNCLNVEAVLEDASALLYRVSANAVQAIDAVYDNGVALSLATSPPQYVDNGDGAFTLTDNPEGTITADVRGELISTASPPAYSDAAGDILRNLITRFTDLTTSDIDETTLAALDAAQSYSIGVYIKDETNLRQVIDNVSASVGGYHYFSPLGLFTAAVFDTGTWTGSDYSVKDRHVGSVPTSTRAGRPKALMRIGVRNNWTQQSPVDVAGSVTPERRAVIAREYEIRTAGADSNAGEIDQMIPTYLAASADGDTEVLRWYTELQRQHWFYRLDLFSRALTWQPGDLIGLATSIGVPGGIGPLLDSDGLPLLDHLGEEILATNLLFLVEYRKRFLSGQVTAVVWGS